MLVHLTIRIFLPVGREDLAEPSGSSCGPEGMEREPELWRSAAATRKFIGEVGADAPDWARASGDRVGAVGITAPLMLERDSANAMRG